MLKDQKELLELFNTHDVKYLVIGGHAVGIHAEPRATKDLDIFIKADPENSLAVFRALKEFGAPIAGMTADDSNDKPTSVFQIGVPRHGSTFCKASKGSISTTRGRSV